MEAGIAHVESFRRKRYLNNYKYRISIFETAEYDEIMMRDIGLRPDRKAMKIPGGWRGWFGLRAWRAEWFVSYFVSDNKGIIKELLDGVQKRDDAQKTSSSTALKEDSVLKLRSGKQLQGFESFE